MPRMEAFLFRAKRRKLVSARAKSASRHSQAGAARPRGARLDAMRSVPARLFGLALLSALLQLLPFPIAGPVPEWRRLISWFCLVPLLYGLAAEPEGRPLTAWQSGSLAYLCGVCWFAGNCYWIYQTMYLYGGLPGPVSLGILVLFSLYLGMYFALFGVCFAFIRRWMGTAGALIFSPVLWVAVEFARARITGFPWDLLGYTQIENSSLTPLAAWTGAMGLSLVVAAGNALWLWRPRLAGVRQGWVGPVCGLALIVVSYAGTAHRRAVLEAADAQAILVQDNLSVGAQAGPPQSQAGPPESQAALLASLTDHTLHPRLAVPPHSVGQMPPQLVVWPEAPTPFASADPNFRVAMAQVARATHAPVVVDAVAVGDRPNRLGRFDEYVSASFFLPDGTYAGRYDKMHLVPFGEYTPYKPLFFFAGHLLDQLAFVPGSERRLFSVGGLRYGVFLCYESIFGDEVRQFALGGAQVLVNLTDDGWYGDTSAPWEHLDMARMRAIENHRWLLRATNTGLTASIDPEGRVVASLPRHIRGAIEVPFAYNRRLTFYTRYGDWIGSLCAVAIAGLLAGGYLQRRYPYRPAAAVRD